ncbi:StbB (plasmid) [Komagataeibacter nataicola]|uniref:StbB n=1 Tax=Komagataeibacter nataicola TaxID=265960 RepID=UPI0028A680BD|nr:StbB [Komagataeibacter nataicola]WNM10379.1 StbB [Komagataeibacter nataicola]
MSDCHPVSAPRICVLSAAGGCGKTVIAFHLLAPFLQNPLLVCVKERIDFSGGLSPDNLLLVRNGDFGVVFEELTLNQGRPIIIDIDMTALEATCAKMKRFSGADEDIDVFLIPFTPEVYSIQRMIWTVRKLQACGISGQKIILVPNRLQDRTVSSSIEDVMKICEGLMLRVFSGMSSWKRTRSITTSSGNRLPSGRFCLAEFYRQKARDRHATREDRQNYASYAALAARAERVEPRLKQTFARLMAHISPGMAAAA